MDLTNKQIKLLCLCNKNPRTAEYLCRRLKVDFDCFNLMVSEPECYKCIYIEHADNHFEHTLLNTNHLGQTAVSEYRRETFVTYFPNIISSLALIVAIAALVVSIFY